MKEIEFTVKTGEGDLVINIRKKKGKVVTSSGNPNGRAIEAIIRRPFGHYGFFGVAVCCPPDEFDFVYGAKLALQRAIQKGVGRNSLDIRKAIWKEFHTYFPYSLERKYTIAVTWKALPLSA